MYTRQPLVFRVRSQYLNGIIGQQRLIGESEVPCRCVLKERLFSMIFYGPPDTGKTILVMVFANELELPSRMSSAVTGNKKDLEVIFQEAKLYGRLVMITGEVYQLSEDKQGLLLPRMENGNITLIGATTSNPLHAISPAIRSRCHLFKIKQTQQEDIEQALMKAIHHQSGLSDSVQTEEEALHIIARHSNRGIRYSPNVPEICAFASDDVITQKLVSQYSQFPNMSMDSDGDGYYDVLSGFQKSIRGNDVDAALYYLGITIEASGMNSIERRLLITAYEDIGLGNPTAVTRCVTAVDATKRASLPEACIILVAAVIGLTSSPKPKDTEHATDAVTNTLRHTSYSVSDYLRFTSVSMGDDEKYDYERSDPWNRTQHLPDRLENKYFYEPGPISSYEKILARDLEKLRKVLRMNNLRISKKQNNQ